MSAPPTQQSQKEEEAKLKQQAEMRKSMLAQILDPAAHDRLQRIAIVKADKARAVEEMLIRMAQSRQLQGRVNEQQLVQLLEQVSEQTKQTETKIKFQRRGEDDDDFDEDSLFQD